VATHHEDDAFRHARLGERIRRRRIKAGFQTQQDFAAAAKVAVYTVSAWERGKHCPTKRVREDLARLIGGNPKDYAA
jgi:transcriptional regulator with XRE-family HTH domain